jgi:hypothetical protein
MLGEGNRTGAVVRRHCNSIFMPSGSLTKYCDVNVNQPGFSKRVSELLQFRALRVGVAARAERDVVHPARTAVSGARCESPPAIEIQTVAGTSNEGRHSTVTPRSRTRKFCARRSMTWMLT